MLRSYQTDPSILLTTNPRFSFTSSKFCLKEEKRPGPGEYSPDISAISKAGPTIRIGNEKRDTIPLIRGLPGPGEYKTDTVREDATTFSFGQEVKFKQDHEETKEKSRLPGPGQYKVNSKKHIRGGKFTNGKRESFASTCLPGPGEYDTNTYVKRKPIGCSIGHSSREQDYNTTDPGPVYGITPVEVYKKSMRKSSIA